MITPLGRAVGKALARYHHRAIHTPRTERVAEAFAELLAGTGPVASLLDVGAGDGRIAARAAERLGARNVEGLEIKPRGGAVIPVRPFDGRTLPYPDASFDAVLIADVLHHAEEPESLLRECLRVARRSVALKDHFAFGALSTRLLLWMDVVGNAASEVAVTGRYLSPEAWIELMNRAGGRLVALRWPLVIHDLPWRAVTRSELQFAALLEPNRGAAP